MLQKINKSYLKDLLFFIILFFGLWAIYKSRAFLLSRFLTKLSHTEFKIGKISTAGLFSLKLYGLDSRFLKIDSMQITASPIDIVKFRLQSISISGLEVFVDSLPSHTQNAREKRKKRHKNFKLPNLPFFLASLRVENTRIYSGKNSFAIQNLGIGFRGTTKNFFARVNAEEIVIGGLKMEFFKCNVYRIGNRLKLSEGELCSNIFCVENIKGSYDSTLNASLAGISLTNANILIDTLSVAINSTFDYGKISIAGFNFYNRNIKNGKILFKKLNRTIKYTFSFASGWISSSGNGSIEFSTPITYRIHTTKFTYKDKEKRLYFTGKLFMHGEGKDINGLFRIQSGLVKEHDIGKLTAFFRVSHLSRVMLDSVFITNKNSITTVSGILTRDSQFLYILPDLYLEDYDSSAAGHVTGEITLTRLKNGKILPDLHLNLDNLNIPYMHIRNAFVNTHTLSEDSIFISMLLAETQPNKGPLIDTITLKGVLTNFFSLNYVMNLKSEQRWLYVVGDAYRGKQEYTFNVDTIYGMVNNMHIYSERALLASYKKGIFYLTTGNLHIENGRLRIQGTLEKSGNINLILISDSLNVPYKAGKELTISTITQVTGNIRRPVFISRGEIYNSQFMGITFGNLEYSLSFVNQTLSIDYLKIIKNGGTLIAYGTALFPSSLYPIKYDSIVPNIWIKFENFDITPLPASISRTYNLEYAEVSGNINLKGTLKYPFLSGSLSISGQNGYLPSVGIRTDNIKGYLQFAGRDIILKSFRAESNAGEIIALGKIQTKNKLFDSPDITISVRDVYVEVGPEFQGLCDANLFLTRGKTTPLAIKGDVKLKEGYLYVEFGTPRGASKRKSNRILSIDVNISWDKNVYLINEIAEMEFSGKLSYLYNRSGKLINGQVSVLGGSFSYLDRLFKVEGGSVVFNNLSKIDPDLNITAITDVDSYTIRLNISGTLTEPVITLSSEPPLDESNIFALLTFGKLLSEAELGTFTADLLEKRAIGFAQGYLLRDIKRKLGLRELEVSTGSLEEDPHFIIGFYVTRDIYLKYYHDLLSVQYDRFELRYRISKFFGLDAIRDEEGEYYLGVFFEKRF